MNLKLQGLCLVKSLVLRGIKGVTQVAEVTGRNEDETSGWVKMGVKELREDIQSSIVSEGVLASTIIVSLSIIMVDTCSVSASLGLGSIEIHGSFVRPIKAKILTSLPHCLAVDKRTALLLGELDVLLFDMRQKGKSTTILESIIASIEKTGTNIFFELAQTLPDNKSLAEFRSHRIRLAAKATAFGPLTWLDDECEFTGERVTENIAISTDNEISALSLLVEKSENDLKIAESERARQFEEICQLNEKVFQLESENKLLAQKLKSIDQSRQPTQFINPKALSESFSSPPPPPSIALPPRLIRLLTREQESPADTLVANSLLESAKLGTLKLSETDMTRLQAILEVSVRDKHPFGFMLRDMLMAESHPGLQKWASLFFEKNYEELSRSASSEGFTLSVHLSELSDLTAAVVASQGNRKGDSEIYKCWLNAIATTLLIIAAPDKGIQKIKKHLETQVPNLLDHLLLSHYAEENAELLVWALCPVGLNFILECPSFKILPKKTQLIIALECVKAARSSDSINVDAILDYSTSDYQRLSNKIVNTGVKKFGAVFNKK